MTATAKHAREGGGKLKKRLAAVAAAAMCLALTGGTLAYFTAEERAHNVITSGGVDIELLEWADADRTVQWSDDTAAELMPGTSVAKVVEVKNTGASEAWVRVKVDKAFAVGGEALNPSVLVLDLPAEGDASWAKATDASGVEWWYYAKPLAPGEVTAEPLFETVLLDTTTGNAYQSGTATVTVSAQAVQVANNPITDADLGVASVAGWPESGN